MAIEPYTHAPWGTITVTNDFKYEEAFSLQESAESPWLEFVSILSILIGLKVSYYSLLFWVRDSYTFFTGRVTSIEFYDD